MRIFHNLNLMMDSKTLVQRVSRSLGDDTKRTSSMLDAFVDVLRSAVISGSSVAIPSFGTFLTVKADEEIVTDRVTGRRTMLPPQITVEFQPAAMLRKKLVEGHE